MHRKALPRAPGIYVIINAVNHHCYVGSTKNLRDRRSHHFRALKCGKHRNAHLQSAYNLYGPTCFIFIVLEHIPQESALVAREQHHMDFLHPEYNLAPQAGRTTGIKRNPELVASLTAAAAASNKGRKRSAEYREYLSARKKEINAAKRAEDPDVFKKDGRVSPSATAKRLATHRAKVEAGLYVAPNAGRRRSPASIAKQQATVRAKVEAGEYVSAAKGRKHTPEAIAKISASGKGRKQSPQTIARSRETKRLKREADPSYGVTHSYKHSAESRAKIAVAHRGKKKSPETIAKRTATRKANAWAKLLAQVPVEDSSSTERSS